MVRIRRQFNPSTLKSSYVAANNTAQMIDLDVSGDPCGCGPTPQFLDVTFSGMTYGCCQEDCALGNSVAFTFNPNGTWRIAYTSFGSDICKWITAWDLAYTSYANPDCTGAETPLVMSLAVWVAVNVVTGAIDVKFGSTGAWVPACITAGVPRFFHGSGIVDSGCANTIGISNDFTECLEMWSVPNGLVFAHGGTADVVAV